MGTTPDQMRSEIEATRAELAEDVNRLADRTSPRRIAQRRTERMKHAVTGLRDRVMGKASDMGEGAQQQGGQAMETVREMPAQAADAVRSAPGEMRAKAEGNPLAAGIVAFGAGLLAASLLPTSTAEKRAGQQLSDRAGEALEPVKEAVRESAGRVQDQARESAQEAASSVRETATEAAQTTAQAARDQGQQVTEQARDSGQRLGEAGRQ